MDADDICDTVKNETEGEKISGRHELKAEHDYIRTRRFRLSITRPKNRKKQQLILPHLLAVTIVFVDTRKAGSTAHALIGKVAPITTVSREVAKNGADSTGAA